MAIKQFLNSHQVFSSHEFAEQFPGSQTDRNLLTRAVSNGTVDKVRRGTYVSKTGRFTGVRADPHDVAVAVAPDAVFCLMSALELHGASHNLIRQIQFQTDTPTTAFTYDGIRYLPQRGQGNRSFTQNLFTRSGHSYRVTTKEQTLIDCLSNMAGAGGPDNLLHSLSGLARLDTGLAANIATASPHSVRARLGWVLETKGPDWLVSEDVLSTLARSLGRGPYYFWSTGDLKNHHWVKQWKLYLPNPEQEMASWLTR